MQNIGKILFPGEEVEKKPTLMKTRTFIKDRSREAARASLRPNLSKRPPKKIKKKPTLQNKPQVETKQVDIPYENTGKDLFVLIVTLIICFFVILWGIGVTFGN